MSNKLYHVLRLPFQKLYTVDRINSKSAHKTFRKYWEEQRKVCEAYCQNLDRNNWNVQYKINGSVSIAAPPHPLVRNIVYKNDSIIMHKNVAQIVKRCLQIGMIQGGAVS